MVVASTATEGKPVLEEADTGVTKVWRFGTPTVGSVPEEELELVPADIPTAIDVGFKTVTVDWIPEIAGICIWLENIGCTAGDRAFVEEGISTERTVDKTDVAAVPVSFGAEWIAAFSACSRAS